MRVPIYQLDAFATRRFTGNPAAVMCFDGFPDDETLQALAAENNLAETAFLVRDGSDFQIRWFTPTVEVPLCGHATLASAAVVLERLEPARRSVVFKSRSGPLTVRRGASGYVMDFPSLPTHAVQPPPGLTAALGLTPLDVVADASRYLCLLPTAAHVRTLSPDIGAIARLDRLSIVVTAAGDEGYDFVSRHFAPAKGIAEDPVTGAAHCALAPYWAPRLDKSEFLAFQASRRGGEVRCRLVGDRVELEGGCVFYLEGTALV
jgi:PhzF family phenazine biosynthesis protein